MLCIFLTDPGVAILETDLKHWASEDEIERTFRTLEKEWEAGDGGFDCIETYVKERDGRFDFCGPEVCFFDRV